MCPPDFSEPARRQDHEWLAEELRRQGLADRPPFSAALHQRIWEAVIRQPRDAAACERRTHRVRLVPVLAGAVVTAAACAAGVALVLWQRSAPVVPAEPPAVAQPQPPPPPLPELLELPRVAAMAPQAARLPVLVDLAASPRWAWLDHDARLTVETLAGQLPRDLATAWSNRQAEKTP